MLKSLSYIGTQLDVKMKVSDDLRLEVFVSTYLCSMRDIHSLVLYLCNFLGVDVAEASMVTRVIR